MYRRWLVYGALVCFIAQDIVKVSAERRKTGDPIVVEEIFQTSSGGKTITCGLIGGKYLAGTVKAVGGETLFTTKNDAVKIAKNKWKKETNSSKKSKLESKYRNLAQKTKTDNKVCSYGPGGAPPSNTPPPNNPNPTPTPASSGNFDANGNVTAAGKTAFGIPSNLSANISIGKSVWQANCQGCHAEKTGRSFSYYKSVTRGSPMFITYITDQQFADLTAHLNRFNF